MFELRRGILIPEEYQPKTIPKNGDVFSRAHFGYSNLNELYNEVAIGQIQRGTNSSPFALPPSRRRLQFPLVRRIARVQKRVQKSEGYFFAPFVWGGFQCRIRESSRFQIEIVCGKRKVCSLSRP